MGCSRLPFAGGRKGGGIVGKKKPAQPGKTKKPITKKSKK
jgi:hypothetical protein